MHPLRPPFQPEPPRTLFRVAGQAPPSHRSPPPPAKEEHRTQPCRTSSRMWPVGRGRRRPRRRPAGPARAAVVQQREQALTQLFAGGSEHQHPRPPVGRVGRRYSQATRLEPVGDVGHVGRFAVPAAREGAHRDLFAGGEQLERVRLGRVESEFGALVYIFQEGHLGWLVGEFTASGHAEPTLPVLMFCVAFGLSMDYEVFLLSRIKIEEEYERSGDNRLATARGLERTGRLVTAAARRARRAVRRWTARPSSASSTRSARGLAVPDRPAAAHPGREADVGEVGMPGVRSESVFPGYWNDSDLLPGQAERLLALRRPRVPHHAGRLLPRRPGWSAGSAPRGETAFQGGRRHM